MPGSPSAVALLDAVRLYLGEVEGALAGRAAFHAKVAGNALAVVMRELEQQPEAAEVAALAGLLGHGGTGAELRAELCAGLRDARFDAATPGLLDALLAAAAAQLAVDNPKYSTLARLA